MQQHSMAVSAPPPGIHIRRGHPQCQRKAFLIVERCNGVVNHLLIQNDKRRIICCVYDDVKTYIVLRNAFRSSNLNNGTGFDMLLENFASRSYPVVKVSRNEMN